MNKIKRPDTHFEFNQKAQQEQLRQQRARQALDKSYQEDLRRKQRQVSKSKNIFADHNREIQNSIRAAKVNQRRQEQRIKQSGLNRPDANVAKENQMFSQRRSNKRPIKTPTDRILAQADRQYQAEALKNKNSFSQNNKRIHRKIRGSSSLMRRYNNTSAEKITKLVNQNLLNIYTSRFVHWLSKGWNKQNVPKRLLPTNTFFNSSNKIYTANSVKMPIILYSFPDYLPIGWFDDCRNLVEGLRNRYNRENDTNLQVSLNMLVDGTNSNFSFGNNKRLMQDYDALTRQYEMNYVLLNDEKLKEREKAKSIGEDIFRKLQTYQWSKQIAENNTDSFWEVRRFIELTVSNGQSAETTELLHEVYDLVVSRLNLYKIKYKDLYATIQQYYDGFSPIGHGETRQNFLFKKFLPMLTSGEQIIAPTNLRQGTISDLSGVPVGVDIYGETPMFIDYSDNNLQPSTFIFATSGSGKTYLIQTILLGFLLFPDKYRPICIDYKDEYVEMARSAGMQIISSSPTDGLYYSTIEIPASTGNYKIDAQNKDNALRTTENIFEILLGKQLWQKAGVKSAFEFIRQSLYRRHNVYLDDPKTWSNSRGLNFHTFYAELDRVRRNNRAQANEAVNNKGEVYQEIQEALAPYFERNGSKASFFKRAIRIDDIKNSRGIVFALGRDQDQGGDDEDVRLNLAMQFILHIINTLTNVDQNQKRLLPIFYEETNRLLGLPKVAEMLSGFASSGRSRGIRNFFISNAPSQVLNLGDTKRDTKFAKVDPSVVSAIISNVGSVIVGPNSEKDQVAIAQQFNLLGDNQIQLLDLLADQVSQDNSDDSIMAHKFLIKHRAKTTLIEAISNPILNEMALFGNEQKLQSQFSDQSKDEILRDLLSTQERQNLHNDKDKIKQKVNKTLSTETRNIFKNKVGGNHQ